MGDSESKFTPAHLKWVVIAILGIVFMVIFKDAISEKIDDVQSVDVGTDGISIKTETVNTPLGKTLLSGPATADIIGELFHKNPSYRSNKGYILKWPKDGTWKSYPNYAAIINAELCIGYHQQIQNFLPNVNVTVEYTNTSSIKQWLQSSNQLMRTMGFRLVNNTYDEKSKTGVRVLQGNFMAINAKLIQRIIIHNNNAYIVTATYPLNLNANSRLLKDLRNILNSFEVVK